MNPSQLVLVLNQSYEPLNVCNVRRALRLVLTDKAEVLEWHGPPFATVTRLIPAPSVVRLARQVRRPWTRLALSRQGVFQRDGYTCQYCGVRPRELTLDHVIPRSRGGPNTWENLVTACPRCNGRKGGRLLAEAHMTLQQEPRPPRVTVYGSLARHLTTGVRAEWAPYLPG